MVSAYEVGNSNDLKYKYSSLHGLKYGILVTHSVLMFIDFEMHFGRKSLLPSHIQSYLSHIELFLMHKPVLSIIMIKTYGVDDDYN